MDITKTGLAATVLGGGSAVDILKPDVTWFLNGCPDPRPDSVDELATILLVVAALLLWHWLLRKDPALAAEVEEVAPTAP